eukprot:scaffold10637_cov86-Isochrysis_galbana.AAC.2
MGRRTGRPSRPAAQLVANASLPANHLAAEPGGRASAARNASASFAIDPPRSFEMPSRTSPSF